MSKAQSDKGKAMSKHAGVGSSKETNSEASSARDNGPTKKQLYSTQIKKSKQQTTTAASDST